MSIEGMFPENTTNVSSGNLATDNLDTGMFGQLKAGFDYARDVGSTYHFEGATRDAMQEQITKARNFGVTLPNLGQQYQGNSPSGGNLFYNSDPYWRAYNNLPAAGAPDGAPPITAEWDKVAGDLQQRYPDQGFKTSSQIHDDVVKQAQQSQFINSHSGDGFINETLRELGGLASHVVSFRRNSILRDTAPALVTAAADALVASGTAEDATGAGAIAGIPSTATGLALKWLLKAGARTGVDAVAGGAADALAPRIAGDYQGNKEAGLAVPTIGQDFEKGAIGGAIQGGTGHLLETLAKFIKGRSAARLEEPPVDPGYGDPIGKPTSVLDEQTVSDAKNVYGPPVTASDSILKDALDQEPFGPRQVGDNIALQKLSSYASQADGFNGRTFANAEDIALDPEIATPELRAQAVNKGMSYDDIAMKINPTVVGDYQKTLASAEAKRLAIQASEDAGEPAEYVRKLLADDEAHLAKLQPAYDDAMQTAKNTTPRMAAPEPSKEIPLEQIEREGKEGAELKSKVVDDFLKQSEPKSEMDPEAAAFDKELKDQDANKIEAVKNVSDQLEGAEDKEGLTHVTLPDGRSVPLDTPIGEEGLTFRDMLRQVKEDDAALEAATSCRL